MSLPFIELVIQRGRADCGLAALAMLIGKPYEDVFAAAITKAHPRPHASGLATRQVIDAARRIGVTLALRRSWDLEGSCGLLAVEKVNPAPDDFKYHMVLLKFGLVFDTDGTVWEPESYFEQQGFRPVSLLVEEGEEN